MEEGHHAFRSSRDKRDEDNGEQDLERQREQWGFRFRFGASCIHASRSDHNKHDEGSDERPLAVEVLVPAEQLQREF